MDYWAKISIGQKNGIACCEGDSVGLSAHGCMFVHRDPSKAERLITDDANGPIDWTLFGPASDEGRSASFLEEHVNTYSGDAKENNFHTKSTINATMRVFLQGGPWLNSNLNGNREARIQSDNASNNGDPTPDVGSFCTGSRCFSEQDMGKDEGDTLFSYQAQTSHAAR